MVVATRLSLRSHFALSFETTQINALAYYRDSIGAEWSGARLPLPTGMVVVHSGPGYVQWHVVAREAEFVAHQDVRAVLARLELRHHACSMVAASRQPMTPSPPRAHQANVVLCNNNNNNNSIIILMA